MAERWKTEYHVIGEDGEAFAWETDYPTAASYCNPNAATKAVRIEKVTYYFEDRETVWERDKPDEDSNPHPYYPKGDPRRSIPYDDRD